ncbi:hypothetical protein [Verrucosispora sp. NA02020]|uniref:hypothetical protein n=1 Tax=Verrucosispora sp. NA02020 TaxID=2742132 RepID=UPI0015925090|nr:hypothetical protein [Verrucosispora sp. NA02020]QKW15453.1 hypothetical protein HUT12_23575 [Verrucosispora sp. NA02020]
MTSNTEPQSPSDPGWVSRACIAWVIDEAPCPTELLPVLTTIARRCSNDGTGSYQSKATLAKKTGKSRDQVDADVKRLLELGLIRLGDPAVLDGSKIPEWQRPIVYDVALEMRGEKPTKAGRNKSGKNTPTPPPGMDTPGGTGTPPGTDTPTPGGTDTSPPGGTGTPQRSPSKNPLKNPSSLSARTSLPGPRDPGDDRERDGSTSSEDQTSTPTTAAQQMLAKHGVHGLEADQAESWIRRNVEHPIQGDGWWYAADGNGSLNTWVQRWRASLTPQSVEVEEIQYCPLHSRFPLYNCNVCWGDWMGGDDPYTGREDERPPGWWEAYDRQKRSGERGRSAEAEKSAGWMALPTSGDERPIMHPHHPNRLINSHANPDRYDVKL